jgi:hypothetical protein
MEFGGEEREPERIEFLDELRRYHRARPFTPFDLLTTSGEKYEVRDFEQFAIGSSAVVLVLPRTGVQIVRMSQIAAIHVHEQV